jgi:hypothetical protein
VSFQIISGASKAKRISYREKAIRRENLKQVVNAEKAAGRPLSRKEVTDVCDTYRARLEKKGYFDLT